MKKRRQSTKLKSSKRRWIRRDGESQRIGLEWEWLNRSLKRGHGQ